MVALPLFYPALAATVWAARRRGNVVEVAAAYQPASYFIHAALGAPDYVSVLKTVLAERGIIASDDVRLPLLPLDRTRRAEVLAALDPSLAISPPER